MMAKVRFRKGSSATLESLRREKANSEESTLGAGQKTSREIWLATCESAHHFNFTLGTP